MSPPQIPDGPEGQSVREAFAAHDLSPSNPAHWFVLLKTLVDGTQKRTAERPTVWTQTKLIQLRADVSIMRFKNPHMKETDACRALVKKAEYRDFKPDTLRKLVHDAWKDPTQGELQALDKLMANFVTESGDDSREAMLAWMKMGVWDVFDDGFGNVKLVPRGLVAKSK